MIFIELNDGRAINLIHVASVSLDGKVVIFNMAKGSLDEVKEFFETESEAFIRYDDLKKLLLVDTSV